MKLSVIVPNNIGILPSRSTGQYWFGDEERIICEAYTQDSNSLMPTNRAWIEHGVVTPLFIHEDDACKFVLKEND